MIRRPALLAVLGVLVTAGCQLSLAPSSTSSTSVAPSGPAMLPAAGQAALTQQLAALQIAPEDTGAHYKRDDWLPQWSRTGDCTTREDVLRAEGTNVVVGASCNPTSGQWVSAYDGVTVTDPRKLDIDHIVPLGEVARSGPIVDGRRQRPGSWPEEQRRAYANDVEGLVAVTASSNRSKGDDDPARWMPDLDHCGYITSWLHMKTKYNLSLDQAEHDAIAAVINTCPA